jgi:hypothetical protein
MYKVFRELPEMALATFENFKYFSEGIQYPTEQLPEVVR